MRGRVTQKKNGKTTNKYDREGSICRETAFCFESECILKCNVRKPSQARHKLSVSTPESNQKTHCLATKPDLKTGTTVKDYLRK